MRPGDIIILITDGFFEWENKGGERFGTDRPAAVVRQSSNHDREVIIAELYDSVLKFAQGSPQTDDLTAVLIKRCSKEVLTYTAITPQEQITHFPDGPVVLDPQQGLEWAAPTLTRGRKEGSDAPSFELVNLLP
jgi:putative SOS response-associated peptidase YedK